MLPYVRRILCWAMLALAFVATTAPMAHVLEFPNKLALDGPAWLLVQQRLYRGWGGVFGPVEIAAIGVAVALCVALRGDKPALRALFAAVAFYVAMVIVFFVFNAPVNAAFNAWTVATMPADWPRYRAQWEAGHALAALFSVIALILVARACLRTMAHASSAVTAE